MTYLFYKTSTSTYTGKPQITEKTIKEWKHLSDKENWRITQLPNGYYQAEYKAYACKKDEECEWIDSTRRETIESAEASINTSIDHYRKRLAFFDGPKVVKTFK